MKFNTSPLQNLSTKLHFPILYLLSEKLNKSSGGFIPESFNKIHWKSTMLKFILILVVVNIVKELDLCFTFCSKNPQKKQIVFGMKNHQSCPPVTIIWRQPFSRECKSGILLTINFSPKPISSFNDDSFSPKCVSLVGMSLCS